MDAVIQFASTVAVLTLGFITFTLSRRRNAHLFIKVGQDVFRWIFIVLACIAVNRLLLSLNWVSSPVSREINSIVFIIAVIGIVASVYRHGQSNK